MPRKSPYEIQLSSDERRELERLARKYTAPYCDVMRAKIVLLASEGLSNGEIAERLDMPRQVVSKWRQRYYAEREEGLADRARWGRRPTFSPSDRRASQSVGL